MKLTVIISLMIMFSIKANCQELIGYGEHLCGEYTFNGNMSYSEGQGFSNSREDVIVVSFSNATSLPFQVTHNYYASEGGQLVPYSEVGEIQNGPEENLYYVYFEEAGEKQVLQFLEDEKGYHLLIDKSEYFTMKKDKGNSKAETTHKNDSK